VKVPEAQVEQRARGSGLAGGTARPQQSEFVFYFFCWSYEYFLKGTGAEDEVDEDFVQKISWSKDKVLEGGVKKKQKQRGEWKVLRRKYFGEDLR
jgi:hypothetical protein